MTPRTPAQVLAQAASTLVDGHDVTDALARVVLDLAEVVGAAAVAIVVRLDDGRLEPLTSTSHRAVELEIFQVAQEQGPCIEVVRTGTALSAAGDAALVRRWPTVGAAIVAAGFDSVHAFPMQWRGQVLGGLNVFHASGGTLGDPETRLCQAVADVCTLLIVQERKISPRSVAERIRETLRGRIEIERAKGALAYLENVDMARAYELLLERSEAAGTTLTEAASRVLAATLRTGDQDGTSEG